jgi:uncharacterized protein
VIPIAASAVKSPCVNICRMDAGTGWCEGCLRTIDEIAAWGALNDDLRREVLALLPGRRRQWRMLRVAAAPAGASVVSPASASVPSPAGACPPTPAGVRAPGPAEGGAA